MMCKYDFARFGLVLRFGQHQNTSCLNFIMQGQRFSEKTNGIASMSRQPSLETLTIRTLISSRELDV